MVIYGKDDENEEFLSEIIHILNNYEEIKKQWEKMFKNLIEKLKYMMRYKKEIIKNIYIFLKNNENKVKNIMYIMLFILNILFIYKIYLEWNILKIIIYLIWIILTIFILDTFKTLSLAISETNEQRFIIYGIMFFWINMSCAFFFIWSNIARPFIRYMIFYWKLYEIIPWKIEIITIEKIINYGFAVEYWEFIVLLTLFYIKIFADAYHYDENTSTIDYYLEYKNTFIYKYKEWIDIFDLLKWLVIALTGLFRIVFINNLFYINDIFLIILFIILFINFIIIILKQIALRWKN